MQPQIIWENYAMIVAGKDIVCIGNSFCDWAFGSFVRKLVSKGSKTQGLKLKDPLMKRDEA